MIQQYARMFIFATGASLSGLAFAITPAAASSILFADKVITVKTGQAFSLPVMVDPAGEQQYTVRFTIAFPSDMIESTSFTFAPNWLPVPQPGYDAVDNKRGELIKTAGFPQGFSSPVPFGTVTFRAKQAGEAVITVGPRSFILSAEGNSTLASRPRVRVVITDKPTVVPSPGTLPAENAAELAPAEPPPDLPIGETNLFDISLSPQIQTAGAGLVSKVAPGELLPLSVKLLNFGNSHKVDVTISYKITDRDGKTIYSAEETVAVETTATFVKTIQIPFETMPGRYIAQSSIVYQDQAAPATTEFPFMVERKILGLFQSDFWRYGGITIILSVLLGLFGLAFVKRRRATRCTPFDYSDIPSAERVFFELLSDTIMGMRQRVGDRALAIASGIGGLTIDKNTGRVLQLAASPSKIIAELVSGYEQALGKKVSFSFRK